MAELNEMALDPITSHGGYRSDEPFGFRLISRREFSVYNSTGQESAKLVGKRPYNPAHIHPDDLAALGVTSGDLVEITSARATITAVAEAAPDVLPGVVSMAHCWGDTPEFDGDVRTIGSPTGRLTDNSIDYDERCGIPLMSAIPVDVRRVPG
ncbi:MAG: molybdopterin dinucleotide binding domain-containing protein [Acidimicrobiia bacterium]